MQTTGEAAGDRVAVVTGAASGIGRAVVAELLDAGWRVVGLDIDPRVDEIADDRFRAVQGDVSERASHALAVEAARSLGTLSGWVNNAAVQENQRADALTSDAIRRQIDVNLIGTMWGCAAAVEAMPSGGSVVSLSSIHALVGFESAFAYAATKGAIVSLARQLAVDFGPVGIRSNSVLPGAIDTAMCRDEWAASPDPIAARRTDERLHLQGRMGQPREIAKVVGFLLSDDASLINGQAIVVDGGALARIAP
ncbi:SDR family oxidoreductase [Microbacterium sp. ISL-59]|uniref:SDR family NAD(P)-dependent oxidoreductase n=1 Tax=Microbacterium sp. ISL-59 TaxID=2819159 RepID=UPI001BE54210|nr:SDR family oxidoreductase [Microbacterium sp. ISL-59]MBT2496724.1 SDR family oxidoreductase [Microbacterium sp. ISL-59]